MLVVLDTFFTTFFERYLLTTGKYPGHILHLYQQYPERKLRQKGELGCNL